MKQRTAIAVSVIFFAAMPVLFAAETTAPEKTAPAARQYNTEENPSSLVGGYRGVTLPMPGDQLLYVKKGDRVDLLVTFEAAIGDKAKGKDAKKKDPKETAAKQEPAKEEHKEIVTATILQNVVVVNVQKPPKTDGTGAVELLVNPNEAQYAALSAARGKSVSLTIRAPGDVELHPMEMASFRRLIR